VKKKYHIRSREDFLVLRKKGKTWRNSLLILVIHPNGLGYSRVAVIVGKSNGNAVLRNRIKRRLRACLEPVFAHVRPGWDIMLIARRPAVVAGFLEIQAAVKALLQQAALLNAELTYGESFPGLPG